MDKIWYRNPSKSEVIGCCRIDKSRMLKKKVEKGWAVGLQSMSCWKLSRYLESLTEIGQYCIAYKGQLSWKGECSVQGTLWWFGSVNLACVLVNISVVFIYQKFFLSFLLVCGFTSAWSFIFFILVTMANDLQLRMISIQDFYPLLFFPILILEKEPVLPFLMLSAKQGNYWYHFYNVFGMMRSLNPGPPAHEASTLPLGYGGGGYQTFKGTLMSIIRIYIYVLLCITNTV